MLQTCFPTRNLLSRTFSETPSSSSAIKKVPIKFHKPSAPPPKPAVTSHLDTVTSLLNRKQNHVALKEFMLIRCNRTQIPDYALCIRLLQAVVSVPKYHALAIGILSNMHTTWKHPATQTEFHITLEALSRANQPTLQLGVVERMKRAGFEPTAETYSLLLLAYCRTRERLPRSHAFYTYLQEAIRLARTSSEQSIVLERALAVALRSSHTTAAEEIIMWITHASLTHQAHGVVQGLLERVGDALQLQPTLLLLDHIRFPLSEDAMRALFRMQAAIDASELPAYISTFTFASSVLIVLTFLLF